MFWLNTSGKGLQVISSSGTISEIPHLHWLKDRFICLESLLVAVIPKAAPEIPTSSSDSGAEDGGQSRLKALAFTSFWDSPLAFSQNTYLLRKWLSVVPRELQNPPCTKAEMTWIPLHKTCVDEPTLAKGSLPWDQSRDDLNTSTHKLGRWTYFGWWTSMVPEERFLEYCYTKLGRWTFFGQWPPSTRAEMTCIQVHKMWQMNLLWLNTMAKVWKI